MLTRIPAEFGDDRITLYDFMDTEMPYFRVQDALIEDEKCPDSGWQTFLCRTYHWTGN